ncbi:MAG: 4-alpha-glucanotransferase [Geminicoccaceae bacterium]|nr:MAG: 4-alpha-glucanotransferase [Geminicoccaceae bacterium]
MTELEQIAAVHGVATSYYDVGGRLHRPSPRTLQAILEGLGVDPSGPASAAPTLPLLVDPGEVPVLGGLRAGAPYTVELETGEVVHGRAVGSAGGGRLSGPLPMGLHRLTADTVERFVLVAPPRCLSPRELGVSRAFGVSSQLYGLSSDRRSAIGDFGDLAAAACASAAAGADLFGLSPMHALFMADPAAISPYSPSHRRFLNPLYIAVPEAAARLGLALDDVALPPTAATALLDYPRVAEAKRVALESLWERFRQGPGAAAFDRFRIEGGEGLERHCRFEALHEAVLRDDRSRWAFWLWPAAWQDPTSTAVEAFAKEHRDRVGFFAFLQWLAAMQLADAQAEARHAGMRLGLYGDLAVGVNAAGSMAWSTPGLTLRQLSIGAPPDPLGPDGQKWGLAPFAPTALAKHGFRPLLDDLEANARYGGAVRIDHVLGFARQFWIPEGAPASEGTYVDFPFEVLARLCALVSHRQRCVVIGEDLGTVPEGFRDRLAAAGMLSCRVLWFERDGDRFREPHDYPEAALASVSTHDLPTVQGFWQARDIDWRADLGASGDGARADGKAQRERDKTELMAAIRAAGIDDEDVSVALHRFLARSAAAFVLVQLEDLAGMIEQPNLPGTTDEHPNWRRRLAVPIETILESPNASAILAAMRAERPPRPGGAEQE